MCCVFPFSLYTCCKVSVFLLDMPDEPPATSPLQEKARTTRHVIRGSESGERLPADAGTEDDGALDICTHIPVKDGHRNPNLCDAKTQTCRGTGALLGGAPGVYPFDRLPVQGSALVVKDYVGPAFPTEPSKLALAVYLSHSAILSDLFEILREMVIPLPTEMRLRDRMCPRNAVVFLLAIAHAMSGFVRGSLLHCELHMATLLRFFPIFLALVDGHPSLKVLVPPFL